MEARRRFARFHDMPEDTEDLRELGDHGDDLHGAVTAGADQRALAGWRLLPPLRSAWESFLMSLAQAARLCLAETDSSSGGSSGGPTGTEG